MRLFTLVSIVALSASAAVAQPAHPQGSTPAVSGQGNNPDAPVSGANSFTEGQAKSRIEARGYASVSELKKDDQGVWRGTAMKEGKRVNVSLDFQGNVVVR